MMALFTDPLQQQQLSTTHANQLVYIVQIPSTTNKLVCFWTLWRALLSPIDGPCGGLCARDIYKERDQLCVRACACLEEVGGPEKGGREGG